MSAAPVTTLLRQLRHVVAPKFEHCSDGELLRAFVTRRDEASFAALVRRHGALVLNVCRHVLGHEQDAEDAFQATFLLLAKKAGSVRDAASLASFLHGVAYRLSWKAKRDAARRRKHEMQASSASQRPSTDELDWCEVQALVEAEIALLPEKYRTPFIRCYLQGLSRAEAARELGVKEGTIWSRLSWARRRLQERLARRGVVLSAVLAAFALSDRMCPATLSRLREVVSANSRTFASGQTLTDAASARAIALAETGLSAFTAVKLKLAATGLLLLLLAGMGGALFSARMANSKAVLPDTRLAEAPRREPVAKARVDRHGDPLPDGAIARLGTVRWRHGDSVHALAYSPDGKMILTAGFGRALVLWDAATGKELRVFPSRAQPFGAAFSPDGKRIATIDYTSQVWDVATGKLFWEGKSRPRVAIGLAFAPDGKTLATADSDESVHLRDPTSGTEKRSINCEQDGVLALAYSPDGATLASGGGDGTICLWNAANGKERRRFTASKKGITSIVFSPDGKYLAAGRSGDSPRLWDANTGRVLRTFGEKQVQFAPLAFSPDGTLLAVGYGDGTFRLWNPTSGEEKRHWHAGTGAARSAAFSPDGKTLATAVSRDGCIRLWDVATGAERYAVEGHRGPIKLLRFTPDKGTLISAGFDRNVLWWDTAAQTPRRRFTWETKEVFQGIALSPDGNTLAVGESRLHEVWRWDLRAGKAAKFPSKDLKRIEAVAFSPDGRLVASAGRSDAIHVWDLHEGKEVRQIKSIGSPIAVKLLFSPDGKTLACWTRGVGGEASLRLWDVADGKERRIFDNKGSGMFPGAFSPDGKVLAAVSNPSGQEYFVHLFDMATGKELCRHGGHRASAVAFSPDGKLVVSGGCDDRDDNSIHVWEAARGRLIRRFQGHHSGVRGVTFAVDGLTVASSAGDSTILLWDITGRRSDGRWHVKRLTSRELNTCWMALANEDAAKGYDAVWALVAAPEQAVPFLRKQLPPVPPPDAKTVARWIAGLDSDDFAVRQEANDELSKLGDAITPALRNALQGKPSLETRRRLQQLLEQMRDWTPERLRDHRAIQALEHIGTPSAREVLQLLVAGAPETRRTEEAKAALRRLAEPRP